MPITAAQVKELRDRTGAGYMDCKNALQEAEGNIEKAVEILRKRGIARAEKKLGRETKEGLVEAYIHPGNRLGVLVEVTCETDFVAKTPEFRIFARDIAMQIAAANPLVLTREDLREEDVQRELEIYRTQARNENKPEAVVEKIAQGKLEKFYQEVCLMEQNFIKDPNKTIRHLVTEMIAKFGENITIKRFVRFQLGG